MAAAAYHVEEEQLWKCPTHPSKRRHNGICPACLRDRLVSLCPNCGNARPCPCTISSSSSSSSSDHSFRRSRSLAIPFLRSNTNSPSFLSVFRRSKTKKGEEKEEGCNFDDGNTHEQLESNKKIDDFARMITRSRSVSAGMMSGFRRADIISSPGKAKFWHFPSRMKAFGSSKNRKVMVQDPSPLHRG